jgi:hypothetical protein
MRRARYRAESRRGPSRAPDAAEESRIDAPVVVAPSSVVEVSSLAFTGRAADVYNCFW